VKGRTPADVLRRMREWHRELGEDRKRPDMTWKPSGIGGFGFVERDPHSDETRCWNVRELLSRSELVAEGRKLRHCVATYADSCRIGVCSIWSFGVQVGSRRKRVLTIEVTNGAKRICQVRGRANRLPTEQEREVLRRWAAQEGLALVESV
jgi:hypothetical protein